MAEFVGMSVPRPLQFGLAQLSRKPNSGRSLSLLIIAEDLPGDGWRVIDECNMANRNGRATDPQGRPGT
jgi:hypothetical protein